MPSTCFPSLLQPGRRAEHALLAVVQEAYGHGVSTRKVDDLVKSPGRRRHLQVRGIGGTSDGERQVLGVDVGPSEDKAFWTAFLRSLVKRGLKGVRLDISDAHEGLTHAISTVRIQGALEIRVAGAVPLVRRCGVLHYGEESCIVVWSPALPWTVLHSEMKPPSFRECATTYRLYFLA